MAPPTDPKTYPPLMTTAEVCELARIKPATVWRWVKAGKLPAPLPGGRLYRRDDVIKALGLCGTATADGKPLAPEPEWGVNDADRAYFAKGAKRKRGMLK